MFIYVEIKLIKLNRNVNQFKMYLLISKNSKKYRLFRTKILI